MNRPLRHTTGPARPEPRWHFAPHPRIRRWLCAVLMVVCGTTNATAQVEPMADPAADGETIQIFRRLMVPEDLIDQVIEGEYLPMSRDRFEEMIAALSRTDLASTETPLMVHNARYYARYEDGQLVDGQAHLNIARIGDFSQVRLGEINLPIVAPTWLDVVDRPAQVFASPNGVARLNIAESGELFFRWSRSAQETDDASRAPAPEFDLRFPRSVIGSLILELPSDAIPECVESIAIHPMHTVPESGNGLGTATRFWRLEVPRSGIISVRVTQGQLSTASQSPGQFRARHTYQIQEREVTIQSQVDFEVDRRWPTVIRLSMDDNMFIRRIAHGGQDLAFRIVRQANGQRACVIETDSLDGPLSATLDIETVLVVPRESEFFLAEPEPIGWNWSESSTEIIHAVDELFEIVDVVQGDLTDIRWSPDHQTLTREVTHFEPTTQITGRILAPATEINVDQGTIVSASSGSLTATTHALLSAQRGQRFEFDIEMPATWVPTSIVAFPVGQNDADDATVTIPLDVVDRWNIVSQDSDSKIVRVTTSRPVRPNSPLRFIIGSTRAPFPEPFEALGSDELKLTHFLATSSERSHVVMTADALYRYRFVGAERAKRMARDELPGFLSNVLPTAPVDLITRLNEHTDGLQAFVEIQPIAIVDADISVDVLVSPGQVTETYTLTCDPRNAKIDHLIIHFSEARPEELRWEIVSDASTRVRAQRIDDESDRDTGGETWRVDLLMPMESQFILRTSRISAWRDDFDVSLASARRALPQSGRVLVRATGVASPEVLTFGMDRRPPPVETDGLVTKQLGSFGYDPGATRPAALQLRDSPEQPFPEYWVLACQVRSDVNHHRVLHHVRSRVRSPSQRSMVLMLPPDSKLGRVSVSSGVATVLPDIEHPDRYELMVADAASEEFDLDFVFSTPVDVPTFAGPISVPSFSFDGPVLHYQWEVGLPNGYSSQTTRELGEPVELINEAMYRLFHPFVRGAGRRSPRWQSVVANSNPLDGGSEQSTDEQRSDQRRGDDPYAGTVTRNDILLEVRNDRFIRLGQYLGIGLSFWFSWLVSRRWSAALVWLATGLAFVSLVGRIEWTIFLSPVLLGVVGGLLVRWIASHQTMEVRAVAASSERPSATRAVVTSLLISAILIVGLAAGLRGQDRQPSTQDDATDSLDIEYIDIVFPIDEENQASGDLVYVPRKFYEELLESGRRGDEGFSGTRVGEIEYRIAGDWTDNGDSTPAIQVTARMQVTTTSRDVRFPIPFDVTDVALVQGRLSLDGQTPIVESIGDEQLIVQIPQAGDHVLEVGFIPRVETQLGVHHIDFGIPASHRAICRIPTPVRLNGLNMPNVLGEVRFDALRATYNIEIGPADRFVMEWTPDGDASGANGDSDVERLYWMTIGDGNVFVEGTVRLGTQVDQDSDPISLPYQFLPHWQLVLDERTAKIMRQATPDESGLIELISSGDGSPAHFNFTLVRDDIQGVGRIRFPDVHFGLPANSEDFLAISSTENLDIGFIAAGGISEIDTLEFARLWNDRVGVDREAPTQAVRMVDASSDYWIGSERQERLGSVSERVQLTVGRTDIQLVYQGQIESAQTEFPSLTFVTPVNCRIQSVAIRTADSVIEPEWVMNRDGHLMLESPSELGDQCDVEIIAELSAEADMVCPNVYFLHTSNRVASLEIRRNESISVELTQGDRVFAPVPQRLVGEFSRLVYPAVDISSQDFDASRGDSSIEPLMLEVVPQPFDVAQSWKVHTIVSRADEGWMATVRVSFELPTNTPQVMDACRLRIADGWVGPFTSSALGDLSFEPSTDGSSGMLVIRPELPFSGSVEFQISGPLASPLRVPNVEPVTGDQADVRRIVELPQQVNEEALRWRLEGLTEIVESDPDAIGQSGDSSDASSIAYSVDAPRFDAVIESVDQTRRELMVRLADHHLFLNPGGSFTSMSTLDVIPSGTRQIEFELPRGSELIRTEIDGIDTLAQPTLPNRWVIRLSTPQLPQRLGIVYRGNIDSFETLVETGCEVAGVSVVGVSIDQHLWTVRAPGLGLEMRNDSNAEKSLQAMEAQTLRMESIVNLVDGVSNQLLELDTVDRGHWFMHWSQRFLECYHSTHRALGLISGDADPRRARIAGLLGRQRALAIRLGLLDEFESQFAAMQSQGNAQAASVGEFFAAEIAVHGATDRSRLTLRKTRKNRAAASDWFLLSSALGLALATVVGTVGSVRCWLDKNRVLICALFLLTLALVWILWLGPVWLAAFFVAYGVTLGGMHLRQRGGNGAAS